MKISIFWIRIISEWVFLELQENDISVQLTSSCADAMPRSCSSSPQSTSRSDDLLMRPYDSGRNSLHLYSCPRRQSAKTSSLDWLATPDEPSRSDFQQDLVQQLPDWPAHSTRIEPTRSGSMLGGDSECREVCMHIPN